jgi:hypothetical protein
VEASQEKKKGLDSRNGKREQCIQAGTLIVELQVKILEVSLATWRNCTMLQGTAIRTSSASKVMKKLITPNGEEM